MKHYCHGGPFLIIEFPYNFVIKTIRHFVNAHNISTEFTKFSKPPKPKRPSRNDVEQVGGGMKN